jgi:hypothetical protein
MLSTLYIQQKSDFTTAEVKEITQRMKNIKAKGYDWIPIEV